MSFWSFGFGKAALEPALPPTLTERIVRSLKQDPWDITVAGSHRYVKRNGFCFSFSVIKQSAYMFSADFGNEDIMPLIEETEVSKACLKLISDRDGKRITSLMQRAMSALGG